MFRFHMNQNQVNSQDLLYFAYQIKARKNVYYPSPFFWGHNECSLG